MLGLGLPLNGLMDQIRAESTDPLPVVRIAAVRPPEAFQVLS
jgi:hypothetical protein